jgi:multiple sugar transport system permease protein
MVCWLIPTIVSASVWQWMYAGDISGILNYLLLKIHAIQEPISWMPSATGAMWALIITNVWKGVPFNMLLLSTALTTLPQDILEAAAIDGAGKVKRFLYITMPMLRPAIVGVITLGFIYTFKTFELIYIMTKGGPVNATENLATVSYQLTFRNFQFSQGAAVANFMMFLLIIFGIISLKFMDKDEVIS